MASYLTNDPSTNGRPENANLPEVRSIFREEAREHFVKNQEKVELPRAISPKIFVYLWILALLVFIDGLIIVFWPWIQEWK